MSSEDRGADRSVGTVVQNTLAGKTIFVGASSAGLGYGIACACVRSGASVWIGSRDGAKVEAAVESLRQVRVPRDASTPDDVRRGTEGTAVTDARPAGDGPNGTDTTEQRVEGGRFDAADGGATEGWIAAGIELLGDPDGLVVNTGGPPPGGFTDFDDGDWETAFQLTLMSSVRMIRSVLPGMCRRRSGTILTVTSGTVKEPVPTLLLSNVFRSGVVSLVKTLSREVAADGVRINNLMPGTVDTDRLRALDRNAAERRGVSYQEQRAEGQAAVPYGRYGTPDEFGNAAAFLLSDAASYITGVSLSVDGGAMHTVW